MMKLPNKELLREVLGSTMYEVEVNTTQQNMINCWYDENSVNYINIYEIAHRCKQWAYRQKIGKDSAYYNGCGYSQGYKMRDINIVTKKEEGYYVAGIDNGEDLTTCLEYYGITGRDNHYIECFNLEANTIEEVRFYAKTEPEAIFKACEWILQQKKK